MSEEKEVIKKKTYLDGVWLGTIIGLLVGMLITVLCNLLIKD